MNGDSKYIQLQALTSSLQNLSNIKVVKVKKPAENYKPGQKFDFTETVISIGNIVERFDKDSTCDVEHWANQLENSCKCCLIKNAPLIDKGKKPSEILKICLDKSHCSKSVIKEMYKQEKISPKDKEKSLGELISHIYNKSIIVSEVPPLDIKFKSNGNLTEEGVKQLLAQAYKENKLKDEHFRSASCLSAQDMISKKGYETLQLFSVDSNCLKEQVRYILKEMKSGRSEIISLRKSSSISAVKPYIYPNIVSGFPTFIFPFAFLSYTYGDKFHYLSLMLRAPGILVSTLSSLYKENKISKDEVKEIFYEIGRSLRIFTKNI